MKTFKLYLIAILTFLLFFAGCIVNINSDTTAVLPSEPGIFKMAAGALIAIYEVVVRLIPTVGDYSGISWVIRWLKRISDTLNVKKQD
jgi:hypothetical protein